jgi:hypothetical protein
MTIRVWAARESAVIFSEDNKYVDVFTEMVSINY